MPRVSVVTPTWHRYDELFDRCLPSVAAQTYRDHEHVVVSDGPDYALDTLVAEEAANGGLKATRFLSVPDHDPRGWNGARARNHGVDSTDSELLAFLDDDNAYRRHHLELLIAALDVHPEALFAYGKLHYPQTGMTIGVYPPTMNQIDSSSFVCRREAFDLGRWPLTTAYALDWQMLAGWIAQGAKSVFIPVVTLDYYWPAK